MWQLRKIKRKKDKDYEMIIIRLVCIFVNFPKKNLTKTGIGQSKYCIHQPFSRCLISLCCGLSDLILFLSFSTDNDLVWSNVGLHWSFTVFAGIVVFFFLVRQEKWRRLSLKSRNCYGVYRHVLFFLGDSTKMPATPVAICFNTNAIIIGSIRPTKVEP